jgi:hypothetical protein
MGNTPVEGMGKTLIEGVENYPSTDMGKTLDISMGCKKRANPDGTQNVVYAYR